MNIIEELYIELKFHKITVSEFEKKIYEIEKIEQLLKTDDYYELISLDFRNKHILNEIENILDKYIVYADYYQNELISMIDIAANQFQGTAFVLMEFYNMYCNGCEFLRTLGLEYGLSCVVPQLANDWNDLSITQQISVVDSFYPQIVKSLMEVREWIDSKTIKILGYDERNNKYIVEDNRKVK